MPKRYSPAELEERAKKARAREAAIAARRTNKTRVHTPKLAADFSTVFYRDPIQGLVLQFDVKAVALTEIGGLAAVGLLDEAPVGSSIVTVSKGLKIPYIKIQWYYGDQNASIVKTPWGTEWLKKYDVKNKQSHYSLPISQASGAFTINNMITKFREYFNETDGTKKNILGENGRAELLIGYGSQWVTIVRS